MSQGFDGILVVVDRFTKMAQYLPINMKITSSGVASNLWKNVFKDVGIPEKIISNQGPQFVLNFMKKSCRLLKIKRNPSTAYHPQTDGQTERTNQEVKQYL
jgi:transposase InsO family protein